MPKVCIDPGHGGRDPGAIGPTGLKEADVNLAVAKRVSVYLPKEIQVVLTRDSDRTVELEERSSFANKLKVDAFFSIHCNSSDNKSAGGTETFCYKFGGNGERLAACVHQELTRLALFNRGVKEGNFHVIRETRMPAALTELAFISNPQEEALLRDPNFQDRCARLIAQGIAKYFAIKESEVVFADIQNHWAKAEIEKALELGLVSPGNLFRPDEPLTRAEAVALLMRLYRLLSRKEA